MCEFMLHFPAYSNKFVFENRYEHVIGSYFLFAEVEI